MNLKKELSGVAEAVAKVMEAELSPKQKAIAKLAEPKHKIDSSDLAKLRAGHKPVEEGYYKDIDTNRKEDERLAAQKKKQAPFTPDKPAKKVATAGKFGYGYSAARHLARKGLASVTKEAVEQIDELSKKTLGRYITRNADDQARIGYINAAAQHDKTTDRETKNKILDRNERQGVNRDIGLERAVKKLTKEEQEFIDELNKSTLGSYVNASARDAVQRTAKEVETGRLDKLADKRMKGIKLATKKLAKEDVDQVEEAVTKTATGYIHHARPGVYGGSEKEKHVVDTLRGPKKSEIEAIEKEKKMKKFSEMLDLINSQGLKALSEMIKEEPDNETFTKELKDQEAKAAGKKKQADIAKGAIQSVKVEEDVEQVEERSLTEPEMKKKEEIVKSMKKGLAGFKARYGDRAKEVMYATSTKIAKEKA